MEATEASSELTYGLVLESSNFYYESGGQDTDKGWLLNGSNKVFNVLDAQKYAGFVVHSGKGFCGV